MSKTTIHLVPFSHMDFGWTYYAGRNLRKICEKISHIIGRFVEKLEADPKRRFTGLGTFDNISLILATDRPLLERIRTLVAEGRVDLPGHLINMPNLGGAEFHLTPESLVRNLVEGRGLHEKIYGKSDSKVVHIPDVTGSFGNLPQLLSQAGYEAYRFDRGWQNAFDRHTFVWRGIDGTEIVANRTQYTGNIPDIDDEDGLQRFHDFLASKVETEGNTPVLHHIGHDLTEPDSEEVTFSEAWNRRFPELQLQVSTYSRFFEEVLHDRSGLPRFEGTIDPIGWTATHGMNGYKERKAFGGLFDAIQEIESYTAHTPSSYPEVDAKRAWFTGLAFQEHGAANFLLAEDAAEVYGDIERTRNEIEQITTGTLRMRTSQIATGSGHGLRYVVFNPLPWARNEPVELDVRFAPTDSATDVEVVDGSGGSVRFQALDASQFPQGGLRRVRLLVEAQVPASGESVYRVRPIEGRSIDIPEPVEANEWDTLENDALRAEFKYGAVKQLTGPDGRPYCRGGLNERHGESILFALGSVSVLAAEAPDTQWNWGMMNRFGKPVTLMSFPFRVDRTESGPIRRSIRIDRAIGDDHIVWRYTLTEGKPYLDVDLEMDTQRSGYRWEMAIPFAGLDPHWWRDEPFGIQHFDPAEYEYVDVGEAMTPGGFFCQSFVDARFGDTGRGVTVLSPDQPGFVASGDVLFASLLTSPPLRFEDRTCRFVMSPQTRSLGKFRFRYRLWTYEERQNHHPARRALEMRLPLRAVSAVGNAGERETASWTEVGPGNIVWSADYVDEGKRILRLYESEGTETEARLRIEGASGLRPVNLIGQAAGEEISLHRGAGTVHFGPFQVRTFVVEQDNAGRRGG